MNTEVYSWRVSRDLKQTLEREARRRQTSLSAVLNLAAQDWLKKSGQNTADDEEQRRLQDAASKCLGAFSSGDPSRAERTRQIIRKRLRQRAR